MTRDELIDAGTAAICERYTPVAEPEERLREDVGVVLDAVEGLIRADERAKMKRELWSMIGAAEDDVRTMLRDKVGTLPGFSWASVGHEHEWVRRADVLALLDGSSE